MAAIAVKTAEASLPTRLVTFFARYPPRLYGVHFTGQSIPTIRQKITKEGNKKVVSVSQTTAPTPSLTSTPSIAQAAATATFTTPTSTASDTEPTLDIQTSSIPQDSSSDAVTTDAAPLLDPETQQPIFNTEDQPPNPFLPYKNPATGRWRGAVISLRRQAELFKLARVFGVESLLPPSRKSTSFKETRLLERGLAVKGTGEGEKVKGHKWERGMGSVLQKRIEAMERMPELMREWRMRGNGRNWKKWPSGKALRK